MWKLGSLVLLCCVLGLSGCHIQPIMIPPDTKAYLEQGKRYYEAGYYKRTLDLILPLACKGNAEAEYVVGYMYYYGQGVEQDTNKGCYWLQQAAAQHYPPAIEAIHMINKHFAAIPLGFPTR
jgi:TPR repeat protein